jgi:hypothetical protein
MRNFKLVYTLMYNECNIWTPIEGPSEFLNRASAMEFLESTKDTLTSDVYLVRKEVSLFYEKNVFDISTK